MHLRMIGKRLCRNELAVYRKVLRQDVVAKFGKLMQIYLMSNLTTASRSCTLKC